METRRKVRVVQIDYECPKCLDVLKDFVGKMRPTGRVLLTTPSKFPHKCTKCSHLMVFTGKSYPYISYE